MDEDELEVNLLPVDPDLTLRERELSNARIQNAIHLIEYEEICADEESKRDLRIADLGSKFGIRHIVVLTSVAAAAISLFIHLGGAAGLTGLLAAMLLLGWFCVQDWQTQFDESIRRRKRIWRNQTRR